ncbi:hypothetical protein [Chitinophaga pollutisoli]|uniref:Uncharacterized protein n=1 Tax=Chitinophaga pollutisoli TaxID=3133966 RepID=A0ABZ2YTP0_9BACT|nr:hypothetical protein [uncultured Chitinophaga sp.]
MTNRLQFIFLTDNLSWEDFVHRAGENGSNLREELLDLLDESSELLSRIGYRLEIVKDSEHIL